MKPILRTLPEDDPLMGRAEALIEVAKLCAATAPQPTREHFSVLNDVKSEDWDFCVTVAGVFVAASRLSKSNLKERLIDSLMAVVLKRLEAWDRRALVGFDDCKKYFEDAYDKLTLHTEPEFGSAYALGSWIFWNVLQRAPSTEDMALARMIGAVVVDEFFDWWTRPNFSASLKL